MKKILLTGAAGFIGSNTATALLARGDVVVGVDNLNDYYDPALKRATADMLSEKGAIVLAGDLREVATVDEALEGVDRVVHLAARPGVRASIQDPYTTISINVTGTTNLLEAMRQVRAGARANPSPDPGPGALTVPQSWPWSPDRAPVRKSSP